MRIAIPGAEIHYSYCMNVHAGASLAVQETALRDVAPLLKQELSPDQAFGLGLRISQDALMELRDTERLQRFREALAQAGCYAFTVNAFPIGAFHQSRVKERVYAPDWLTLERLRYTCGVCATLAQLLPEGVEGSVSTVPLTYGGWPERAGDLRAFVKPMDRLALYLQELEQESGSLIHIGLEPEPDCALQTTAETIGWFQDCFFQADAETLSRRRRYIGVCLDTCHAAMQFEDPSESLRAYAEAGIRVSKVQLSAALELAAGSPERARLRDFDDGVYLHQVKSSAGQSWPDLPALFEAPETAEGVLRVHCHVPLHWRGDGDLRSTLPGLGRDFSEALAASGCRHVEVETYTFDVLPAHVRDRTLTENLARELEAGRGLLSRCGVV